MNDVPVLEVEDKTGDLFAGIQYLVNIYQADPELYAGFLVLLERAGSEKGVDA